MPFPDITKFPGSPSGPYERDMGRQIFELLRVFNGRVPDSESHQRVLELAASPRFWAAAHAVFDEVRKRMLVASDQQDHPRILQYELEESCCKAIYNATGALDEFDTCSPFFVVPNALGLARKIGLPLDAVTKVLVADN
jgi:hypothetical protein